MKRGDFYGAIATLIGTIIGAGVLSIPYVIAQAGFLIGMIHLIVIGFASFMLFLYIGEVVLRTKGNHQLTGYAEKYLGKKGKYIMTLTMVFGTYGALTAYLIGEGEVISALFNSTETIKYSLIFFAVFSLLVYFGLKVIEDSEMLLSAGVITIIILTCVFALHQVNLQNLAAVNISKFFLPYGAILFAMGGAVAVPEMKEELSKQKHLLKKAIMIGVSIPIILYLFFAFVVVGVMGSGTTEVATIGLGQVLGEKMVILGNLFAMLAMATSFLTLGLGLKEMYNYDYKFSKLTSWFFTVIPPLFFFISLEKSFSKIIGITGGLFMGLEGIMIVLMYKSAKKKGARKPEYEIKEKHWIDYTLIAIFVAGMVYTICGMFGWV